MGAILISFLAYVLLQFKGSSNQSVKEAATTPEPETDGFFEFLAKTPPRNRPEDLYKVIHSPNLEFCDERDLINLMQDAIQTYIRPNMGEKETLHVRTTLLEPLTKLHRLQSDRLYGGKGEQKP